MYIKYIWIGDIGSIGNSRSYGGGGRGGVGKKNSITVLFT